MTWSINLFVLAIGFIIVGMYKPQLLLFWMDKPKRAPIMLFSGFLFMVGATMFGEANREKQQWLAEKNRQVTETKADTVPTISTTIVAKEEKTEKETVAVTKELVKKAD